MNPPDWFRSRRSLAAAALALAGLTIGPGAVSPAEAQCSVHPWADVVVESTTTTGNRTRVLGKPDLLAVDFENDGNNPGFVTVQFDGDTIVDRVGNDFAIHLIDFVATQWVEAFELFVSEDGSSWVSLGLVAPKTQSSSVRLLFDLQPFGVSAVKQIKVVNSTVNTLLNSEGPDLDAFEAVNCGAPNDADLAQCLDDLDACSTELLTCVGDLDDCEEGAEECSAALGQTGLDLERCEESLAATQADLVEVDAGLVEIARLLSLPPGRRRSDFSCSGQFCPQLMAIIRQLLDAPAPSLKTQSGRR